MNSKEVVFLLIFMITYVLQHGPSCFRFFMFSIAKLHRCTRFLHKHLKPLQKPCNDHSSSAQFLYSAWLSSSLKGALEKLLHNEKLEITTKICCKIRLTIHENQACCVSSIVPNKCKGLHGKYRTTTHVYFAYLCHSNTSHLHIIISKIKPQYTDQNCLTKCKYLSKAIYFLCLSVKAEVNTRR